jgi:thiol-disulfide isomerase/thioredoxin
MSRFHLIMGLILLAAVGCTETTSTTPTDTAKPNSEKNTTEVKRLSMGDPAPAWQVSNWLNGPELAGPQAGTVYVLEFWATWCPPCIKVIPHLTELQVEYKNQGLIVIGMTRQDSQGNSLKSVTQFVERIGSKMGYTVGFDNEGRTEKAYMQAAQMYNLPCSFVIDRNGKIAYIGHPNALDDVLPRVLAGTWKGQADLDEITRIDDELSQIFIAAQTSETTLENLEKFCTTHPVVAKRMPVQAAKLGLLIQNKKWDEAKILGEFLLKRAEQTNDAELASGLLPFANKKLNPEKKQIALALSAADLLIRINDRNPEAFLMAASIYAADGKKEHAATLGQKAVGLAPNDQARKEILRIIEKILATEG